MDSAPIYIYTADGDFEEPTDLDMETLRKISKACENGSVCELERVLNLLEPAKLGSYLNAMTESSWHYDNYYLTPLMFASCYGQDSIVRFLLENYSHCCIVDAQNYMCYYDIDYEYYEEPYFNKQTALWLAVKSQHLNVVHTLISIGKANVNHKANGHGKKNLTPLGLACLNGQLEMVKYLVENGANLYNVDEDGSTSLMIASAHRHYEIIQYLLRLDDISNRLLNAINNKGSTALHELAYGSRSRDEFDEVAYGSELRNESRESADRRLNIVKLLLEKHHAKIIKNKDGFTPLTIAGIMDREELMEYYVQNEKNSWYTISQIIDELELIGSRKIDRTDGLEESYRYLLRAMELRYSNPKAPILKTNLSPPIDAYQHCRECQTVEELQSIEGDSNRMRIECLMIHERLALTSDFLRLLHNQAVWSYRRREEYQRAVQLLLHAYRLKITKEMNLHTCIYTLEQCVMVMNEMIYREKTKQIQFDAFMTILEASENEFRRNRNLTSTFDIKQENKTSPYTSDDAHHIERYDADEYLYVIRNLLFIGIQVLRCSGENEKERRRRCILRRVQQFIDLDYRTVRDNKTLLHLSLMEFRNYTQAVTINYAPKFPSLSVVELLLSCRAPINAIDYHHNTPLHELAGNRFRPSSNQELANLEKIFKLLVDTGAHLDAVAGEKTPEDCAEHEKLKDLFQKHPIKLSLKCICARIIQRRVVNYTDRIPSHLQSFIQLH